MQKHKFNIFPEMQPEDYGRLKADIQSNGYDMRQPIYIYNGGILDGWNRYKVCMEIGVVPIFKDFSGTDIDAIDYVMRTNKRRNLTSSQWAAVAVEADEIVEAIKSETERQRREKISEARTNTIQTPITSAAAAAEAVAIFGDEITQLIGGSDNKHETEAATKLATTFNTNRTYINEAARLKEEKPEIFEQVKSGEKTLTQVKKEQQIADKKAEYIEQSKREIQNKPSVFISDAASYLSKFADDSIDLILTDPPYMTDVLNIEEFTESWLPIAIKKTKKTGRIYICSGAYPEEISAFLSVLLHQNKFIVDAPLIWTYRNTLGITPKMKYNLNYQIIWHLYSAESSPLDTSITNEMFSVQDINAPDGRMGNRLHTWQKPDELAYRLIRHSTKENDLVIDPFVCTGTFLLAAAKLRRIAAGCDISEDNLKIAEGRGCIIIGQ